MAEVVFGLYQPGSSLLHRLDPRVKLGLLILVIASLFVAVNLIALASLAGFLLILVLMTRLPWRVLWRTFWPAALFAIFPLFFNLLFVSSGSVLWHWWIITITDEGVYRGIFMAFRLFLMFASAFLVTLTTSAIALAGGIGQLLAPWERLGFPAYEISLMISIALRFIPDIGRSFNHIRKAQQARGAVFNIGGPLRRARALVPCLVPLFAQCFRNAEYLALAMESRCYHGGTRHTVYREYRIRPADILALLVVGAVLAAQIVWRVGFS